jgi:2,6-dihydroxypyridine 3-monooxygenase
MSRKRTSVAIIGGSLVGPATELLLRRKGFEDVTTYEAMPRAHSQSGGVMGLRPATTATLHGVGVDLEEARAIDDPHVYAFDMTANGPALRGASEFPGVTTSWDALHDQLAAKVDVRYRHRVISIEDDGGRWHIRFANGKSTDADMAVFTDGRKSWGRERFDPLRPLVYNGYVTWRGLAEPPERSTSGFERFYDGRHGRLFSVTEPLRQSGRAYWELSHNLQSSAYARVAGGAPEDVAFILPGTFERSGEAGREIVRDASRRLPVEYQDMIEGSEVAGIPVNDTTMPTRAVFYGEQGAPAVLVGDALLPVRLQVGAGLNQGLSQAGELVRALHVGGSDPGTLRAWESETLDRLAPWVELGRSRAHRSNLGTYDPVRPGKTAAPVGDAWADPVWVTA